ncbi:MAG: 2Fe-2S iron-sulfur cluster-binding protein [Novosphingobium sp.]
MVLVKFIDSSGVESQVSIDDGTSVMEGAIRAGIDGIDADCGGQLSCATCHVYVGEEWEAKVAPMSEDEDALLEFAIDRRANSRLCCQIIVRPDIEGLVIEVPASQGS